MRSVILVSIALGILWNVAVVCLMGGKLADGFALGWLTAGALAGVAAAYFTIWSRKRRDGDESLLDGLATYFVGMFLYWASFVVVQRAIMCIRHGGWTDFDLHDHLSMILVFVTYGTVVYGVVLIHLCFLTRHVVWKIYLRTAA